MQPKLALNSLSGMTFFLFKIDFYFVCMSDFLHIFNCTVCIRDCAEEARRESARTPETRITCSHGCWESILDFH